MNSDPTTVERTRNAHVGGETITGATSDVGGEIAHPPAMLFLFRCPCCEDIPAPQTFPLCHRCASSLRPGPQLCSNCGNPHCPEVCARSWAPALGLRKLWARYLLVGAGYPVLKRWKVRGGPSFDRRVLVMDSALRNDLRTERFDAIVPIPQDPRRSWTLGRSPARRIAQWLSTETGAPVREILARSGRASQQGKLGRHERRANALHFECVAPRRHAGAPPRILLVDDFFTTGHTFRQAAQALERAGIDDLCAFALGLRPDLGGGVRHERSGLDHGARGAKAVSEKLQA